MGAAIAHNRPKRIGVTTSEQNSAYFSGNLKDFLHRLITMDGIWIHHYTLELRER